MTLNRERYAPRSGALATVVAGLLAAGVAAASLGACSTGSGSAASQLANPSAAPPVGGANTSQRKVSAKVAMLLPLSAAGHPAVVAKGMKQAAEMALFDNNNPGFRLVVKDTRGTEAGAAAAATAALSEGVELIIGPMFSKSVAAVSQVARQARVPVIAFSNDQQVAGNGTYLLSFLAQEEVDRIVRFAASQGRRQYAALVPDNAYGKLVEAAFRSTVAQTGGAVVALERYPANAGGVLAPARKLMDVIKEGAETGVRVDALFVPGGVDVISNLGPVLSTAQLDMTQVKLLGSGGWDYPNLGRESAFVGGWYPAPDPRSWRAFSEQFTKTFGSAPPRISSLAHNAVTIAIRLAATNPKGSRYTPASLTRANGFSGADGLVRFNRRGLAQRGLAVLEVQAYGPRVVSPAPQSFSAVATTPAATGSIWGN